MDWTVELGARVLLKLAHSDESAIGPVTATAAGGTVRCAPNLTQPEPAIIVAFKVPGLARARDAAVAAARDEGMPPRLACLEDSDSDSPPGSGLLLDGGGGPTGSTGHKSTTTGSLNASGEERSELEQPPDGPADTAARRQPAGDSGEARRLPHTSGPGEAPQDAGAATKPRAAHSGSLLKRLLVSPIDATVNAHFKMNAPPPAPPRAPDQARCPGPVHGTTGQGGHRRGHLGAAKLQQWQIDLLEGVFFAHLAHPYPTKAEKARLGIDTELTDMQVRDVLARVNAQWTL